MSTNQHIIQGQMNFDVDASILIQLGEQLVTRNSIALAELIKNAYDADATQVYVILENVTNEKQDDRVIIIEDNGVGMTLEIVKKAWMTIATDYKERNPRSPIYKRSLTGKKGIGRFAARRLADKLTLVSVAVDPEDNRKKRITANFDWAIEFRRGRTLDQINVDYSVEVLNDDVQTGVTLYLEHVKDIWTSDEISRLNKDLVTIINPFDMQQGKQIADEIYDPGFRYFLDAPEFPDYTGELRKQFLDASWAKITGKISSNSLANYELKVRSTGETLQFIPEKEDFSLIPEAAFEIYYFVYTRTQLDGIEFKVHDLMKIGREQGGIRIYQDQFRVFPYGDTSLGDDWLRLDSVAARRTTGIIDQEELNEFRRSYGQDVNLLTPGNNQVFGAVKVSQSEHPNLKVTASREGFAENEAFEQLRRFVQIGLQWLTVQYARITFEDRQKRKQEREKKRRSPVSANINSARERIAKRVNEKSAEGNLNPDDVAEIVDEELGQVEEEAKLQEEESLSELAMLRILSATGTTVNLVQHQLRAMVLGLRDVAYKLEKIKPFVEDEAMSDKLSVVTNQTSLWHKYIEQQVSQLGFLLGETARTEKKRVVLKAIVERVFAPYESYTHEKGITTLNLVPPNIKTPEMFEAELYTILLHTFTNALKAVREQGNRIIGIDASMDENSVTIHILDTGIGIYGEDRESVFSPFKTTTNSSEFDFPWGVGTGLGLWIVKDIVTEYQGNIHFTDVNSSDNSDAEWVTCLAIQFKK